MACKIIQAERFAVSLRVAASTHLFPLSLSLRLPLRSASLFNLSKTQTVFSRTLDINETLSVSSRVDHEPLVLQKAAGFNASMI